MNGREWQRWELRLLKRMYPSQPTEEIAEIVGRTITQVYGKAHKLGLAKTKAFLRRHCRLQNGHSCGRAYQFPKGHTPANKGLRRPGYAPGRMRETQFKKGQVPHTWKPVGTILADSDGFLRIKVRERLPGDAGGWNSEVWPCVHHQVWKEHNGPIPPKHMVVFKDRNRQNCAIENLELISMADNARRNSMWAVLPRDLAECIHTNAMLKRRIRRAHAEK